VRCRRPLTGDNCAHYGLDSFVKQDRVARLLREMLILQAHPHGVTTERLAEEGGVSRRQAQRDLKALEVEVGLPLFSVGPQWRIADGYWLPSPRLTLPEAAGLMMGARLLARHADRADGFAPSAYEKLASVMPDPVRPALADVARELRAKPIDPHFATVMSVLISAWARRQEVEIEYNSQRRRSTRRVWPLSLEPSTFGRGNYLIAWDPDEASLRTFKVERIVSARPRAHSFEMAADFSISEHLQDAWGVWTSTGTFEVELLFAAGVASRVRENNWHPSQRLDSLADGRIRLVMQVPSVQEIRHWVLGWGSSCEVVRPAELRRQVMREAEAMWNLYGAKGHGPQPQVAEAGAEVATGSVSRSRAAPVTKTA